MDPVIYVDGKVVGATLTLANSPLKEGAIVSIGDSRGCLPPEPHGLVELRVVSGPGAGAVHRMGIGTYTIGAAAEAAIRLGGSGLPDVIGTITVSTVGEVTLRSEVPDSALGMDRPVDTSAGPIVIDTKESTQTLESGKRPALLELNRKPLDSTSRWSGTTWPPGAQLTVGPVILAVATIEPPDASLSASPVGGTLDFNRPPRLLAPPRLTEFTLPAEPQKPHRQGFPLVMMALPLVGSVVLALFMRQPSLLLFGLLSPLMYLGQFLQRRREGKTSYRQQLAEFRERKLRIEGDAIAALAIERNARRRDLPDAASLLLLATGPRARLWERRPTDPD
ncbi:hypothetical protein AB0L70_35895 [Kribbella sp. NPDC051952]|uniref:hypothetical protein n=1 Tax=Kribbella sp. NPDC051952 TaxID=3154851 RepID=UPI00343990F9